MHIGVGQLWQNCEADNADRRNAYKMLNKGTVFLFSVFAQKHCVTSEVLCT